MYKDDEDTVTNLVNPVQVQFYCGTLFLFADNLNQIANIFIGFLQNIYLDVHKISFSTC